MVDYSNQGHPDRAIDVAVDWLKKHPGDGSADLLYSQIAMCYLQKASRGFPDREQSLQTAATYFDKDLAAHRSGEVDIEHYEVGRGFEAAGDLSTKNRCSYYARAIKEFQDEAPFIVGESYTAYGTTIPLAPVQDDNEKASERVKAKLMKAACN